MPVPIDRPRPLDPRDILAPRDAERLIDALARIVLAAARVRAERAGEAARSAPTPKAPRKHRPSPSRLAKWEAQWQADADAEGES